MKYEVVRRFALALPEASEAPHHAYSSFRVRGKIFVTVPPEQTHIHVFIDDQARDQALALDPQSIAPLLWGGKVVGVRIALAQARVALVKQLVRAAWTRKAPKALVGAQARAAT